MISIIHKNVQNCKYFLDQGKGTDISSVRFLQLSSLGFEFCLEHLDVMDRLDDDLQLWQFARLLELRRQHPPQVLHVSGANVGGVQVKVSNLHNHDDDARVIVTVFSVKVRWQLLAVTRARSDLYSPRRSAQDTGVTGAAQVGSEWEQ